MSNNYSQPPKWDPNDPAGSAKAYADWLQGQSGGGTTNQASAGGEPKDKPANFTVLDPASAGTTWLDPIAHTTWQAAQGVNGKPYVGYANAAEVDRIMGAGTSAKQASDAAAAKQQSVPDPPNGFKYITGTDKAYAPPVPGSKATALGSTAFYNTSTGKWSVYNATASDLALVKSQGLGTTPPAADTTKPAAAGQPATQPTGAPAAAPPALSAPPLGAQSPYAQTQAATKSIVTPQSTGLPQQSVTVPNTYQGGPSGFQSVQTPQGQQNMAVPHEFSFGPANFNPAIPTGAPDQGTNRTVSSFSPVPGSTTKNQDPLAGTSAGLASTGMAPPPPTPQGLFRPPNVGDAGLVSQQLGATGPINSTLSPERQAFVNQMYPTALAWSQQTGIPPEVYLAINGSESNFGKAGSLFGVMGQGDAGSKAYDTHEVVNGQNVPTNSNFANYSSPNAAYQGFQSFLQDNPRYAPALAQFGQDHDSGALLQNINKAGYATDPNWATMIQSMANDIRPNLPAAPNNTITGQVAQGFTGGPPPPPAGPGGGNTTPGPDGRTGNDWANIMQNRGMLPGGGGGAPPTFPVAQPGQRFAPNVFGGGPPLVGAGNGAFDYFRNGINAARQYGQNPPGQGVGAGLLDILRSAATAGAGAVPTDTGPVVPPAVPQTNLFYSGPQTYAMSNNGLADRIGGLNGATGYNPQVILAGNGIKSTGDADLDATIAAQIIQKQNAMGDAAGFGDPLAAKGVGASTTFQSPLSGGLENEQRTDHGYNFTPGNVNAGPSLRSPMDSGQYTPIMTPQGVVLQGANNAGSPAAQAVGYQQAGYGQRGPGDNPAASAPYLMAPTSNVGAVIQAAQAGPQSYASAANLPSQQALDTLAQANKDPLAGNTDFQNAGGGMMGDNGGTRFFAAGGNFDEPAGGIENRLGGVEGGYGHGTPAPFRLGTDSQGNLNVNDVQRALQQVSAAGHSGYQPRVIAPSHPMMLARGGSFITTQPTMFPMRGGGTAETSEYGQPELINQHGSHVKVTPMSHASNMSPLRGYANGGTFTTTSAQAPNTTVSDGGGFTPEGNPIPTDAPASTAPAPTSAPADPFTQQGNPVATYTPPSAPSADLPPTNNNQFTPQGGLNPNYVTPGQAPAPAQNLDFNTPSATAGDLSLAPLTPGPAASPTAASLDTNPELGTQTGLANQQNARNNRAYLYSAAGVGAPIGISSQTQPTNLGPNQYWAPIDYTGQIQNRQTQLAALSPSILGPNGQPLDPNTLVARQNVLRDMLGRVWGGNQPVVSGGNQPAPQGGITDIDPGVNDPTTGQWMTQSQIQAEMAANSLQTQQIQQANQLEAEIANLRANQPSVTPQPVMSQNTSAAQTNAALTPASNPNLQVFLSALNDQSNTGTKRKAYDPMAVKAA